MSTAKPLAGETAYEVGGGRLDLPSTVDGTVLATGSASFGEFDWPHGGDAPVERSVTYTNLGDEPVTLQLSEATTDAADSPAPAGLFTFSSDQVTVPAQGTADVTVTAHPDDAAAGASYSGTVVASTGDQQVAQTAIGLVKEEERYDLDIATLDRQGKPGTGYVTVYRYGDQYVSTLPIDPVSGKAPTQRLLPGHYNVTSWLPVDGPKGTSGVALVGTPDVEVGADGATSLVLDARDANPITSRTAKASEPTYRRPGYFYDSGIDSPFAAFVNQYAVSPAIDAISAPTRSRTCPARWSSSPGGAAPLRCWTWRRAPRRSVTSRRSTRVPRVATTASPGSPRWRRAPAPRTRSRRRAPAARSSW